MEHKLTDVILVKTSFERIATISFDETLNLKSKFNVNHSLTEENDLIVRFSYNLDAVANDDSQFKINCEYVVQFELKEYEDTPENNDYIERFSNVNAAAIVYPFIRELIYSITSKGGMLAIVIPSMNFIKEYDKKKAEENESEQAN